jgi:hypothetical protein
MAMTAAHLAPTSLLALRRWNGVAGNASTSGLASVDVSGDGEVQPPDNDEQLLPEHGLPGFDAARTHLVVAPVRMRVAGPWRGFACPFQRAGGVAVRTALHRAPCPWLRRQ